MITVYHNSKFLQFTILQIMGAESASMIDPEQLVPVAIVDGDLDTAFRLVQHLDQPWYDNPQIQVLERSRSTSVGDVLRKDDGTCWLVKDCDFEQIENLQLPEEEDRAKSQILLPQDTKRDSSMSKFIISDLLTDIFLGPPSIEEIQRRYERDSQEFPLPPGQSTQYIQKRVTDAKAQKQEPKETKILVDDTRAQEVFQATRYLINEGFSRGYFTTRDFDNRDIIEYHAIQGNILLKGNKITGELLDHCLGHCLVKAWWPQNLWKIGFQKLSVAGQ